MDKILICGYGVIPKNFLIYKKKIINCHSRLIPESEV